MNGGKHVKKERLQGHSFEWVDGSVKCSLCNMRFYQTQSMYKHLQNEKHTKFLDQKNKDILNLQQSSLRYEDIKMKGMTVSIEESDYQYGSLIAAANGKAQLNCIKHFKA